MANFRLDSKSIRKQIKNIIEEQYKENIEKDFGMIILKELIQNANDAYANSLFFGYHSGLKSSKNPLFQNAGLFFINDGEFKKSDLISINKMWDNEKGNNPNQIGKFGLGLKSIFHWCEAFCYLSSGISDTFKNENAKRNYNEKFEIFNPWEPTFDEIELCENSEDDIKPYPEWSINSEEDYSLIVNEIEPILSDLANWFCIWIPLRSRKLEKKPAFKNFYPGDDKTFYKVFEDNHLRYEISSILPFMSKLQNISFWRTASKMEKVYTVHNKISFPMIEENRFQTLKPYQTDVFQNNSILSQNFVSYNFENNIEANELIDDKDFPRNEEGNTEKAFNQAAISISIINEPNKEGKIILDWNVFLPLSEKRFESICKGYSIFMKFHGWFFIDSGRNTIDFGKDDNELTIKQQWNRLIAEQNTIPQLIPTIKKLIEVKNDSRIIEFLIQHIRDSEIYKTNWMKDALCSDYSIIYRFRPSKTEWSVLNSNEPYYSISKDYINNSNFFVSFNNILESNIFLNDSTQLISSRNQDIWSKEFFICFFEIYFNELLINHNFRKFWIDEIRTQINNLDDGSQEKIKLLFSERVKRYFINTEWKKIEEQNTELNDILEIINDKVISLSIETKKTFNLLNSLKTNLILVPYKYYKYGNIINKNEAIKILGCISENEIGNKHKLTQEILIKSNYSELKEDIIDLPIFEISDHDSNKTSVSINDIGSKVVVDANSSAELIKRYTEAFQNVTVYKFTFYNDLQKFKDYFPSINSISLKFISDRIENYHHKFQKFVFRKALINIFLKDYKSEYKKTIRKLFLGEHQDLSQDLYVYKRESIWYKISREILQSNKIGNTIFLDNKTSLSEENIQDELKIYLTNNIPINLFQMNLDNIDLSFIDEKQIESIYKRAEDEADLLSLPIYKTVNGEFISLSDKLEDVFMLSNKTEQDDIPKENIFLLPYNKYLSLIDKIKQINNNTLLKIYLKSQKPENYTMNILVQLEKITNNELDEELRELLTTVKWVPSNVGEFYSISNIFYHRYSKDFDEIINEYYESTDKKCEFISSSSLTDNFIKHNGFQKLNEFNLWNDENMIFERIGELLERTPKLNIGKIYSSINLDLLKVAFVEVKEVRIVDYLRKWQSNIKPSILEENIVSSIISETPPLETQIKICEGLLKSAWKTEVANDKKKILDLHQKLVESYLKNNNNLKLLNNIKLLNVNNKWCNANTLCLQDNIIPNSNKLNDDYNSILKEISFIVKPEPKEDFSDEDEIEYTNEDILQLFKEIANSNDVQRNLVGIFLSFLGDGNRYWKEWAQNYFLENGLSVESIRNEIRKSWESQWRFHNNRDFEEHFNRLVVSFEMFDFPTNCIVHTITGENISVKSESVLIAPKHNENYPSYEFGIYKLDINNVENLKEILKQALDHLVLKIHNFKPKDSCIEERLWKDYSKSSQLSISVTQQILIQDMISIFRRLGLGRENEEIKRILLIKQSLEHKKAVDLERGDLNRNYAEEEKEIRKSIKEVIKLDDIQKQILIGIKNELKDFQYTENSVIFELFQNADDAYLEKETLDLKTNECSFKIFVENNSLYVIHNGRNINQHKGNRFNEEEHWGFSNDLQKMLTLNYSDKELNNVTGKFGLGFKSVFLICDNPKIISGDLSFEILGGIYPSHIIDKNINKQLEEKLDDPFNSTLICLPIKQEIILNELLSKFTLQAPFLPIFSKKIEKILIEGKQFIWEKTKIIENLFYSKYNKSGLLIFTGENWKIVFGFSEQGFSELENINKIWVTVPTDTETKYNFVINSDFNIDVGRRQLASEGNSNRICEVASQFSKILSDLISIDELPLAIKKYTFWESLFLQLTHSDSSDILWPLFWKSHEKNYLHLLNYNSILPNGLEGLFSDLICLTNTESILADELNNSEYLTTLSECGFKIKKCVSQEIEKRLKSQISFNLENINLSNFKSKLNENLTAEQQARIDEIEDQVKSKRIASNEDEEKQYKDWFKEKREQEQIEQDQEENKFENQIKYSYSWFKCIVDADCKKEDNSKSFSEKVRFTSCKIAGNKLTFINPSRYLLQSYDTAESVNIIYFSIKDNIEKSLPIKVEGVTFIETRAEVLLEKTLNDKIKIEFVQSQNYWLEFKNYIDVSQKIRNAYYELNLEKEYSFKDNLPKNIEFIFGPPGTGKTFNIANKIIRFQQGNKVLVLTPTNKAADEICLKIKENTDNIHWISRFGNCGNEEIINDKLVYHSGSKLKESITTTIATSIRYSYDGYRETNKFADTKWDYIIFDEASMIPIQYISYIIYKSYNVNPDCSFIIAGDPKQIPPIYNFIKPQDEEERKAIERMEDLIEGENIYSMVELYSFDPIYQNTEPYSYLIENLDVQYRSISPIGKIFSNYAYNGLLKHNRNDEQNIKVKLDGIDFKEINIINFPLAGGEIYRSRTVESSHTHPYIAILISEFLYKIDSNQNEKTEIGIISPYKSQVKLISKLIGKINYNNLDIQVDTVHGFQGGQKDIIFCIFNPKVSYGEIATTPKFTGDSPKGKNYLNRQYIINVAISRAKDYLFLLLPSNIYLSRNEEKIISGLDKLYELEKLKELALKQANYITEKQSAEIEKWCFNRKDYIYQNSNVIPHDLVNVYKESPKKYLVSHNDQSIDIQIKLVDE
ncbi:MAG: AAA family ATPase [Candidatus Delongbacteria bacterium]|nr:AAA family ATPase [Candidatus Delongbacteria bacterium]